MNARERMLAAINRQPVDRVPTDIWATGEVIDTLKARFGEDYRTALHIDGFAGANPRYIGPPLPATPENEYVDYLGNRQRRMGYGTGAYMEQVGYALAEARTIDDLERYAWFKADWWDFSDMLAVLRRGRETHATQCGYMAPFYFHNLLRGLEQSLTDPHDDPDFTHHLLNRLGDAFYDQHRRMFEVCEGLIDVTQVTDDYGSQTGPMIGLQTFRTFYKPHLQRFIDLAHEFGIKVMHHDDGAMRVFLPDLVAMGIDILNPVQWNCPGMEIEPLKREFGDRLCFHGGVENQKILPFGTPAEVRAEVRKNIDILAADGTGYILASCHNIQPVTPIENIIAMYDEAYRYGKR